MCSSDRPLNGADSAPTCTRCGASTDWPDGEAGPVLCTDCWDSDVEVWPGRGTYRVLPPDDVARVVARAVAIRDTLPYGMRGPALKALALSAGVTDRTLGRWVRNPFYTPLKTHCRRGHPFDPIEKAPRRPDGRPYRVCRPCRNERIKAWRAGRDVTSEPSVTA